jgi:MarR family transcriptional regulator for hemolysin
MRTYEFKGNFLFYVRLVKRLYEKSLGEAAMQCGLTLPEAGVLLFLRENPEFDTARDMALYCEVSRAYVSKAVEALAKRKYIKITQDKADRRLQHLAIADAALEIADALHRAQYALYDKITSVLTDAELAAMLKSLEKCAINAAQSGID